jgi:hypothetical protein
MTYNKHCTRYYSSRQEKRVAKAINGKTVANSGAPMFCAGDVTTDDWLIECKTKTTECKSVSIQKDWILKNEEEAFAMGKQYSAVCFDFGDGENNYIISEKLFKRIMALIKEDDNG